MSHFHDVRWFDGKNANGHFVLELFYRNGGKAYMKNRDIEKLRSNWRLLQDCPDVVDGAIYNPEGEKIEYTLRSVA